MNSNFQLIRLGDVLTPVDRSEAPQPGTIYRLFGVKWWGEGAYEREAIDGSETQYAKLTRIEVNDVVINKIWVRHGSVAVVPAHLSGCYGGSEFPTFVPDYARLEPRWIHWISKVPFFWQLCAEKSFGSSGKNRIRPEKFLEIEIPLPPLDEQRRIVAHIDALTARIAEARELRQSAAKEAEAVLSSAKGDLFDDEFLSSFPTLSLGSVAEIQSGVTLGRNVAGETVKVPYLRVANVQDGYLDLGEVKEIEIRGFELEKWQLSPGDILLTEGGDWDKLGRGTVWQDEIANCIHQNHVFRVRIDTEAFDPYFLMALISSPYGKTYFQQASKQTTNLASINQRQLKAFRVVQPPLSKQQSIVQKLNDLRTKLILAEHRQAETAAELDALLPSVLDRAFKGDLF